MFVQQKQQQQHPFMPPSHPYMPLHPPYAHKAMMMEQQPPNQRTRRIQQPQGQPPSAPRPDIAGLYSTNATSKAEKKGWLERLSCAMKDLYASLTCPLPCCQVKKSAPRAPEFPAARQGASAPRPPIYRPGPPRHPPAAATLASSPPCRASMPPAASGSPAGTTATGPDSPAPPAAQPRQPPLPDSREVLMAFQPAGRYMQRWSDKFALVEGHSDAAPPPHSRLMLKTLVPTGIGGQLGGSMRDELVGRLKREAEAMKVMEGRTGDGGLPIAAEVVAEGDIPEGEEVPIRLMGEEWQKHRDGAYKGDRPAVANTRVEARLYGHFLLSNFAALLPEATRAELEEQQPPPSPLPQPPRAPPAAAAAAAPEGHRHTRPVDPPAIDTLPQPPKPQHPPRQSLIPDEDEDYVPSTILRARAEKAAKEAEMARAREAESGDEGEERRQQQAKVEEGELWTGSVNLTDILHIRCGRLKPPSIKSPATARKLQLIKQTLERLNLSKGAYRHLMVSCLSSLEGIHGAGWVHGDTNGQNAMVVWDPVTRRLYSPWIDFEVARATTEAEQPLTTTPPTLCHVEPVAVPPPHCDPTALRRVAKVIEAVIDQSEPTTAAPAAPQSPLYGAFSRMADSYAICSLAAAILMGPHMDHPSGPSHNHVIFSPATFRGPFVDPPSGPSDTHPICGQQLPFFPGAHGTRSRSRRDQQQQSLYGRHFEWVEEEDALIKVAIEEGGEEGKRALHDIDDEDPTKRHKWLVGAVEQRLVWEEQRGESRDEEAVQDLRMALVLVKEGMCPDEGERRPLREIIQSGSSRSAWRSDSTSTYQDIHHQNLKDMNIQQHQQQHLLAPPPPTFPLPARMPPPPQQLPSSYHVAFETIGLSYNQQQLMHEAPDGCLLLTGVGDAAADEYIGPVDSQILGSPLAQPMMPQLQDDRKTPTAAAGGGGGRMVPLGAESEKAGVDKGGGDGGVDKGGGGGVLRSSGLRSTLMQQKLHQRAQQQQQRAGTIAKVAGKRTAVGLQKKKGEAGDTEAPKGKEE
ncbi:unnamed protein product [Vitrella brassicaformis CCMP3155]|uniref:Protein kinase domain-containing protein n=1 Tax=Vitrella brassicaformis (strain CCMP3155) TaxID=1169540 RepID=A0A0G4F1R2_VITBC|nr:unnamed protein product [Vitrella brassicaformis CCMP3155]|eukprot:CEM05670.1 unnamed protein product [Vitrella brassicaformis CCMP3155]